jgi:hypothetical protein
VPPFTQEYFDLGPAEISWIFMSFGLGMMAAFLAFIFIVSKKGKELLGFSSCPELNILLLGVSATIVAFVGYLIIAVNVEHGKTEYLWAFIGVSVIMLVADPASITTVTTLISLMVHEDVQGRTITQLLLTLVYRQVV